MNQRISLNKTNYTDKQKRKKRNFKTWKTMKNNGTWKSFYINYYFK